MPADSCRRENGRRAAGETPAALSFEGRQERMQELAQQREDTAESAWRKAPGREELVRLVREVAVHLAREKERGRTRLAMEDGKLVLQAPEGREEYSRNPDGSLLRRTGSGNKPMVRTNGLDHALQKAAGRVEAAIYNQMDKTITVRGQGAVSWQTPGLRTGSIRAARDAALEICQVGSGEEHNSLQDPLVRAFCGEENARTAELAAGKNPGLIAYNRVMKEREAAQELLHSRPAALVLWARRDRETWETANWKPWGPEAVRRQARAEFAQQAQRAGYRYQESSRARREELWEAFCQLDPDPVRNHPQAAWKHIAAADLAAEAGAQPGPEILEAFLGYAGDHKKLPKAMIAAAFREGLRPRAKRALAAAQLALALSNRRGVPEQVPDETRWESWVELCPPRIRDLAKPRREKTAPQKPGPGRLSTAQRAEKLLAALGPESVRRAQQAAAGAVRLRTGGNRAELLVRGPEGEKTAFSIVRTESGALAVKSPGLWIGDNPELPQGEEGRNGTIWAGLTVTDARLREAARVLAEELGPGEEEHGPETLNRAAWELVREGNMTDSTQMSLDLRKAVLRTLDPRTLRTARSHCRRQDGERDNPVTVRRYNLAATGPDTLEHLSRTNPGALAWAFQQGNRAPESRHPGQVIAMVRREMEDAGLPPGCWRYAATIPRRTAMALFQAGMKDAGVTAALAAAAMAGSGLPPGTPRQATELVRLVDRCLERPVREDGGTCRANALRAGMLLHRHMKQETGAKGQDREKERETRDACDYVHYLSRRNPPQELRSTTWKGLLKAADRWHRDLARARAEQVRQSLIRQRDGRLLAWNSLVGEEKSGEQEIRPLTDEWQLLDESRLMEHCVFSYGDRCAQGSSRIFALSRSGVRTATTEIELGENGQWEPVQTRGFRNGTPGSSSLLAAQMAADRYNAAWRNGRGRHRSWVTEQKDAGTSGANPRTER